MRPSPTTAPAVVPDVTGLGRLRSEARARPAGPYLLTVTAGGRPHCGTAAVTWEAADGPLTVRPVPRTWAESEAAGHLQVTLLWPPAEPGGYDLIADGAARYQAGDDPALVVTVSRAVLHRRGPAPAGGGPGCGSDCVPLTG